MENLVSEIETPNSPKPPVINESILNDKYIAFLDRFKGEVELILEYCIEHDPAADGTKITLLDE